MFVSMMQFRSQAKQGFTLIELLVVIGVMMILASVVLVGTSQYREYSRDKKRETDIKQYELAFKLYAEANGGYPECNTGAYLRSGGVESAGGDCDDLGTPGDPPSANTINAFLQSYFGSLPQDPFDDGSSNEYVYFYDGENSDCDGAPILAVRKMEGTIPTAGELSEMPSTCGLDGDGDLDAIDANPYIIRLDSIF